MKETRLLINVVIMKPFETLRIILKGMTSLNMKYILGILQI